MVIDGNGKESANEKLWAYRARMLEEKGWDEPSPVRYTDDDIREALHTLPDKRTPTAADWARLSKGRRPLLDRRIEERQRLRDRLDSGSGWGCLSPKTFALSKPHDVAAGASAGAPRPRWAGGLVRA